MSKKVKKNNSSIKKINKNKKKYTKKDYGIAFVKILLIFFILAGLYYTSLTKENTIPLLAVNENEQGVAVGGSIIKLSLTAKPGSGNIYVNLNTIEEVDTQISIINSNKIACDIFKLDCENYDFYYEFTDSALVLKGPSASSAIAILTAKTLNNINIDKYTVITGSLNSGGVIGVVGGVEEKVRIAKESGFKRVLIPTFSNYNQTVEEIEVIEVMDIVEAYNNYNGDHYQLEKEIGNIEDYKESMKNLAEQMCSRSQELKSEIKNISQIANSSSLYQYKNQAEKSFNSSQIAKNTSNYYSMGSFCYNANINYQILLQRQSNQSLQEIENKLNRFNKEVILKQVEISSDSYKNNITTINDFYVYLLLNDRIEESKKFIEQAKKIEKIPNNNNNNFNITFNESISNENETYNVSKEDEANTITRKETLYSYSLERFYTVEVWEEMIKHNGKQINFDEDDVIQACVRINREIVIKSELLKNYGYNLFDEEVAEQNQFSANQFQNNYLCIYQGLELTGRIDTVLNSIGITQENQEEYSKKILKFAQSRIGINANGNFPLIPYMYSEYSQDLYNQQDYGSSMLYSNYALAYGDLNIYLEEGIKASSILNETITKLFENVLFWIGILILLAFIGTGM